MVTDPPNKVKPGTVVADPFSTSTQAVKPGTIVADPFSAETQPPPKAPAAPVSQAPELDPFGDVIAKPSQLQQDEAGQRPIDPLYATNDARTDVLTQPMRVSAVANQKADFIQRTGGMAGVDERSKDLDYSNSVDQQFASLDKEGVNRIKTGIKAEAAELGKIQQSLQKKIVDVDNSASVLENIKKEYEQKIAQDPAIADRLMSHYEADVNAHNKLVAETIELQNVYKAHAKKIELDKEAVTRREMQVDRGIGNWGDLYINKLASGLVEIGGATADIEMGLASDLMTLSGAWTKEEGNRFNKMSLDGLVTAKADLKADLSDPVHKLIGLDKVTAGYEEAKKENLLTEASLGLVEQAPALALAFTGNAPAATAAFFAQGYSSALNEMTGPEWADVPANERRTLAALLGGIDGALEKFGATEMIGSTTVTKDTLRGVLSKLNPSMDAGTVARLLDGETSSVLRNLAVRLAPKVLGETLTESEQSLAGNSIRDIYESSKYDDLGARKADALFSNPETVDAMWSDVKKSAIQGALGAGMLTIIPSVSEAMNGKRAFSGQTDKQYEVMEKMLSDKDFVNVWKAEADIKVEKGELTKSDVDKAMADVAVAQKIIDKMPEDMPADKRRQAFGLLLEKERLSKKEKAMVEGRVQDIDNELRKLAGIPIKETGDVTKEPEKTKEARFIGADGQEYADTQRMRQLDSRATKIIASLPEIPDGHARLWRGNREGEVGINPQFTNALSGIAMPFQEVYGGPLSYVDVPQSDLAAYEQKGGVSAGNEFRLPADIAARAVAISESTSPSKDPATIKQNDGSVSKDGGHRFIVDGRISLPVKGDGSQDAIRETTAWADEVTSLNDGTIILTDPDNGPVQKLVVGRGDETSFWLEDAKTGEVMWKSGDNIGLLKSRVGNGDILSTPTAATANIDPEGELTDDQLNAIAEDPSLASTKAATGGGVDVNDSAAINELATRLQGLNKAGADYAAIIGKVAKAATTLRSITPGVNIQVHETADTIPVGDASSGNRGVLTITGRDANGNAEGTIHINLDQATENTIAHEIGHVALRQAFGADPKLFTQFKERIKKAVKPSDFKAVEAMMGKDYSSAEAPEEFLADLTQMVSDRIDSGDPLTAKEITVIDKVVAIINDFLKALGIDPILVDPRDARATLEFFRDLGAAANAGVAVNTELAEGVSGVGTVYSRGSEPLSTNQISEREELMPYGDIRGTIMSFVSEDAYSEGGNMTIDEVVRHIKEARGKYSVTNIKAILGEAVKAAQETWADVQSESMSNSEAMAYKDAISALKEMASMPDNADVRALVRTLSPRTERGQRVTDPDDQPEPSIRYSKADSNVVRLLKGSEFLNAAPAQRKQMLIDARAQDAAERAAQEAKVAAQAKAAGAKQERVRSKEDLSKMKEQYKAFIDSYDAATKKSMAELEEEFIARNAKDVDLARAAIDNLKAQLQESKEDLKRVAKDGFNLGRGIGSVEGEVRGIGEGLKKAAAAQKKIREDVAAYLSLIKQKGDISVAQSKALINAAMRIKVGNEESFAKFEQKVDKVMDDVAYAARIEQIRKLQAKANKKKHSINGSLVQAFTSIDPELIPDELMPRYISALTELSQKNPRYATMTAIASDVEALKQPQSTGKYDAADTYEKLEAASNEILGNKLATVEDYTRMLADVRDFNRQANALLENGTIDGDQYAQLTDGSAKTIREFNEQNKDAIDEIRKSVIDDIKVSRSYVDLERTEDPDKKLLQDAATLSDKQMMALDPVQLQDLSELISNGVTDGYVDSFRLHPIVVKAKLYADAENLANNLRKVSKDQNELEKILARTDTSYWSSVMGIAARHASLFDKMIIAPWLHADGGRIKFKTEANNELYKLKKKYGLNPPLAKKVINDAIARTIPNPAMDKIGMVVRYLEEYELGTKKEGFDEFGSYGKRDQFSPEAMAKLNDGEKMKGAGREATLKNWEKAWKSFPKTDGKVDPSDVYESVMANDGRYLTKEEGGFLKELLEWKSKNITPKQRYANSLRGIPFDELQFHMPRRAIGPRTQGEEDALTTPVAGGNRLRIRSGTGFARKDTKLRLMETNIETLFSDNAESTARDFYFTPALSEVSTALSEMDKQLAGEGNTKGVVSKVRDAVQQSINSGLTPTRVNKLLSLGMAAQSMRVLFKLQRVPIEMLSSFIESGARVGSIEPYKRAFTQYNGLRDDAFRLMSDTGSQFANKLANLRHLELKQGEIQDQGAVFKASMAMAAAPETVMVVPVWTTVFESSFKDTTGENFSMEKYKSSAIYRATHKDAIKSSGVMADTAWGRFAGSGTAVGQKRKQNALVADVDTKSNTGAILSYMTGYTERQRQALLDGIRYAVQTIKGESGIEKARGTAALATTAAGIMTGALTYAMGMQIAYLASQYLTGDDDEKRKAKEEMDRLGNADYMAGEAMASAISLIGTKYGGLGRHLLRSIGSTYYSHLASQSTKDMDPETKREHKNRMEWVKKAVRNFTYFNPVDITAGASPTKAAGQAMLDIIPAWSAVGTLANEVQQGYKSTKDLTEVDRDMEDSMILMTQASLALWNAIGFMYGWQAPSRLWDKKAATITKEQELGKEPTTPAGYRARAKAQIMKRIEEERQMESEKEFSEKELMDKLSPNDEE